MRNDESTGDATSERELIIEAQDRFDASVKWESNYRNRYLDDIKIDAADAYNGYQWPNDIKRNRDVDERPCLTINIVRQHNLQIINDARKNTPGIRYRPTGNGATKESANAFEALARHIEYESNAKSVYDTATGFQVRGGLGWIRIVTEYEDDKSFDQVIRLKAVADPLTVYIDPFAKEPDKNDMRYAFVFEDLPHDQFNLKYPEYKDVASQQVLGTTGWITDDKIRVAEYFRIVEHKDTLYAVRLSDGSEVALLQSQIPPALRKQMDASRSRVVWRKEVQWKLLIGNKIAEEKIWPGDEIPLVPVIGEETVIDGLLDRKGHTRAMVDPQRIYNYWSSAAVESVALQSKTPYVAPVTAIEGLEEYWATANQINHSVLPYNGLDDAGNVIPMPQRQTPPVMPDAYIKGMTLSMNDIMVASGQFQAQMGEQGNERTGRAINERQRQGDNATYHYIDNLATAIRRIGKILLQLIPKVYDTQRVIMAMAEDGTSFAIELDPTAKQAFMAQLDYDNKVAQRIFNPLVGRYDVQADVGPGYGTKRQEAFDAFTLMLTQAPQLTSMIGDLLMRYGDFPGAEEAAERLKRAVPPEILGQGPTQQEQALAAQVQQMQGIISTLLDENAKKELKLVGKDEMRDIDAYEAETKRMGVLKDALALDERGLRAAVQQVLGDVQQVHLGTILAANEAELQGRAPEKQLDLFSGFPDGTRRAPDGNLYAPDPARPGGFAQVIPQEASDGGAAS